MKLEWARWANPLMAAEPEDDLGDGFDRERLGWETPYRGSYMATPNGIVPLGDAARIDRQHDLWVLHSDADVTPRRLRAVAAVPGVELVKPLSRYRTWVGLARLFDPAAVKAAVEVAFRGGPAGVPVGGDRAWALVRESGGRARMVYGPDRRAVTDQLAPDDRVLGSSWRRRADD